MCTEHRCAPVSHTTLCLGIVKEEHEHRESRERRSEQEEKEKQHEKDIIGIEDVGGEKEINILINMTTMQVGRRAVCQHQAKSKTHGEAWKFPTTVHLGALGPRT